MIDVIQVFKCHQWIKKADYHAGDLRQYFEWEQAAVSKTGYIESGTLYLPATDDQPGLENIQVAIIQDIKGIDPFVKEQGKESELPGWYKDTNRNQVLSVNRHPICFCKSSPALDFEIFHIEKNGHEDVFDLFLNYTGNAMQIGIPSRNNHKIAELKLNEPVRYTINGKADFTLSGRKQRTFSEYDYIIEYVGKVTGIAFKDLSTMKTEKRIAATYKSVDERKILK